MFRIILIALSFIGIVNAGNLENDTYTESFDNGNPNMKFPIKIQKSMVKKFSGLNLEIKKWRVILKVV